MLYPVQLTVAALLFCVATANLANAQQGPAQRAIEPDTVQVDEYMANEYFDPNLLAIKVKRAEDRILALEENVELLTTRYNDLAGRYNDLLTYLKIDTGTGQ
ncbi:hypothetical protein [uncultured Tateyamaria sp.]|uniref:hypothetical protein n=1 Tax=uncultured Tateyamaria sp. TaxID=455651 RepID=UPI00261B616A|nr:hypothetical protein [uncultured Tateyamaria sp.]